MCAALSLSLYFDQKENKLFPYRQKKKKSDVKHDYCLLPNTPIANNVLVVIEGEIASTFPLFVQSLLTTNNLKCA